MINGGKILGAMLVSSFNRHARHASFHIGNGGYPGFRHEWFGPTVSLSTSVLYHLDVARVLFS